MIQKEREKIWNEVAGTDLRLKEEELIEATERYFIGDDFIEDLKEFSNWYGKRIKDDILAIICLP